MSVPAVLARLFAAAVVLAAAACSTYLDARAEAALREALLRVVGPAESYDDDTIRITATGSRLPQAAP